MQKVFPELVITDNHGYSVIDRDDERTTKRNRSIEKKKNNTVYYLIFIRMRNKDLILILTDKSANTFGQLIGLNEDEKLITTLIIIHGTIETAFGFNSNLMTPKALADILERDNIEMERIGLLTKLLWTQAEILLKLDQTIASLIHYENALLLLLWPTQQTFSENYSEKQNEIVELKAIINLLKPASNQLNCN